eukprot:COSAG01_NODE_26858_length_701_cov_1.023256_1_plen_175_part_10
MVHAVIQYRRRCAHARSRMLEGIMEGMLLVSGAENPVAATTTEHDDDNDDGMAGPPVLVTRTAKVLLAPGWVAPSLVLVSGLGNLVVNIGCPQMWEASLDDGFDACSPTDAKALKMVTFICAGVSQLALMFAPAVVRHILVTAPVSGGAELEHLGEQAKWMVVAPPTRESACLAM